MIMDERLFWLGFSCFPGIGPKKFKMLLDQFGSAKNAWKASEIELADSGIGPATASKFVHARSVIDLYKYLDQLRKSNVQFTTLYDDSYPKLLKEIENPPFVIYVKGESKILRSSQDDTSTGSVQAKIVAIVGTRKITEYGREVTEQITSTLVHAGFAIVSGLAFGVDSCAHRTTIENNGKTIAVLGCGIDCCSPREHEQLYRQIIENGGAIISEFPFSEPPTKGSFPSRNRIIAGLSQAVIVTEGAEDSGALYTAHDALKIGRPVFAVPGPITSSLSKGPNNLIANGAKMVTSVGDILVELGAKSLGQRVERKVLKGDNEEEQKIIDLLQNESWHFDEIVKKIGLDSVSVGVLLSLMEMKGIVKTTTNGYYFLNNV